GRALTLRADEGFVRVTARADNHLVLGIAAVGPGVSELSAAFGLALEMGARLEDIAGTIHAHPTLGEAFHEASLRALGEALHSWGVVRDLSRPQAQILDQALSHQPPGRGLDVQFALSGRNFGIAEYREMLARDAGCVVRHFQDGCVPFALRFGGAGEV